MSTSSGPTKQWWKSKTIWLHVISAAIIAVEMNFKLLQPHIGAEVFAYSTLAVNAIGASLRLITTKAVAI